ncbi:MAG: CRTAC1 family protein [Planctomycetes bacterium]|nr:CRTAC1 family protein [Planctomycetota bacterium]
MVSRPIRRACVSLAFCGALGAIAWYDRHQPRVAGPASGTTAPFHFTEAAKSLGIDFVHHAPTLDLKLARVMPHVAAMGAAVSVADANGDGRPDLYATNSAFGTSNALFVRRPDGKFEDVAASAGVGALNVAGRGVSMGSIWGDYDGDGDEDLFVYRWGYPFLARNDGDLKFTDVTAAAGLERWINANGAVWLDYDRDGKLDLYVCGYFSETIDLWHLRDTKIMQESFEFASNGGHNYLFHNQGDGHFEDVTARMGCDTTRWSLGVAAADLNDDGWIDLYVANDYGPEEFFVNRGGLRFELMDSVGLAESSKSGMCVALGDFENRGALGVYVTNISVRRYLFQGNNLRLNRLDGEGRFYNDARDQVADCGWAWGAQFGDFDNDGWRDLFVANGFISASKTEDYWYEMGKIAGATSSMFLDAETWPEMGNKSLSGYERSRVLWNKAGRGWTDVAPLAGVDDLYDGRAVALADLDGRGALDVIVANQRGPLLVYRADANTTNHWVGFELVAKGGNTTAIGSSVKLFFGGRRQVATVDGGSGFCSQNQRRLLFGVGPVASVEKAIVRWPSGAEQEIASPALGVYTRVVEGASN